MSGKKTATLVIPILLGLLLTSFSIVSTSSTSKAFAASSTLNSPAVTSTTAPTLRLPFNGSFPIAGDSYGCGLHVDNPTKYHDAYALDFGTPDNTQITAVAGGIFHTGSDGNIYYGTYAWILHPGGFVSVYAHLMPGTYRYTDGQTVQQGWWIANSGHSGGVPSHLHFSFRQNATSIIDGVPAIPEPMSGYRGFKYYGYTSARGGAPNNCPPIDLTTKFNASNSMTRQTLLAMEFPLLGISYRSGDNNHPNINWDWVNVQVYNINNIQVANIWNNNVYNNIPGAFVDYADLGPNFPAGNYYVHVRMNNTLGQYVYGINVVQGLETFVLLNTIQVGPTKTIRAGDIDNNNQLDILDYNDLMSCYGNKSCNFHNQSDLNRDGNVDGVDYNIWLRYYQGY